VYTPPLVLNGGQSSFEDSVYQPLKEDGFYQSPYSNSNVQGDHFKAAQAKSAQPDLLSALQVAGPTSETSGSPRTGSTPSKTSGETSHTSAGLRSIKQENEDPDTPTLMAEPLSPSTDSSQLSPARSTTPVDIKPSVTSINPKLRRESLKAAKLRFTDLRPRTSIPSNISPTDLARESIHAAYSSRLNPFTLHPDEYQLLRNHICHLHVSAYLNIRNRILRLWVRNPLVSVTADEAAGCALASRWLGLAEIAYQWLLRKGYINFGCVEVPDLLSEMRPKKNKLKRLRRKTIIVIGAGMAGLGCARQLEGLFSHYREKWVSLGEETPRVVVLEGRSRIGGRVYSHPLKNQNTDILPEHSRCTAEMGAHIITGFDHGNPLSMIIRGQLALPYYPLKDNSTLFDLDGQMVDKVRDTMVEKLYNDVLDRASIYRHRIAAAKTVDGDKKLIEAGRDPQGETGPPLSAMEGESDSGQGGADGNDIEPVPGGVDKLTGKAHMIVGSRKKAPPAKSAETMGWRLASNVLAYRDLNLDAVAKTTKNPTLGAAMDEAVKQYQFLLDLSPQDMRLINWHYANLEYANAANVGKLSLGGWDQDIGNEFEGEHAQIIGGYLQVPRGIWQYPSKLDLRTYKAVKEIAYTPSDGEDAIAGVICDDGDILDADHVVLTVPLGVLKEQCISFDPPLPDWKLGPIERLGFGTLNKVILVFEKPFWDVDQDMFGLLREAEVVDSLDQEDYESNRGKFYLFWNCIKTSGLPVLIALMAGDAAHHAENVSDAALVAAVTQELSRMFKQQEVPIPSETIVTRWGKDRFARGSYSYVGPTSRPGDYEAMARPLGNLHFAGEATCGTHPATVHGAYISGLRAASEVIDALLGPIQVPSPLVLEPRKSHLGSEVHGQKHKAEGPVPTETQAAKEARLEAYESDILSAIYDALGYRPSKPGKPGSNPFLLFTKDQWGVCKNACDDARRAATGNPSAKASRNEVRIALGQMWREASEEVRRPYLEQTSHNRIVNTESAATFEDRLAAWDVRAMEVRRKYVREHPGILSHDEEKQMWQELGEAGMFESERRVTAVSSGGHAEDSGSEIDIR
jgi:monoamine oxidase